MGEQEVSVPERVRQDAERAAENKARQVRLGHVPSDSEEEKKPKTKAANKTKDE